MGVPNETEAMRTGLPVKGLEVPPGRAQADRDGCPQCLSSWVRRGMLWDGQGNSTFVRCGNAVVPPVQVTHSLASLLMRWCKACVCKTPSVLQTWRRPYRLTASVHKFRFLRWMRFRNFGLREAGQLADGSNASKYSLRLKVLNQLFALAVCVRSPPPSWKGTISPGCTSLSTDPQLAVTPGRRPILAIYIPLKLTTYWSAAYVRVKASTAP